MSQQDDERIARKLLDLSSRSDRVQIRNGVTYLDGYALGNGTVEIRSQVARDRRRRFVAEEEKKSLGAVFVGLFRRNSDGRFFVHPPIDTTSPSAAWDVGSFIDAGINSDSARVFIANATDGSGWVGWKAQNHLEYFSSSGNGFFTVEQIAAAIGIPSAEVEVRDAGLCQSGNWGQALISRAGDADPFRRWRVTYNKTGVLSWNTIPNSLERDPDFYLLPSVTVPFPDRSSNTGFGFSLVFKIISNADNSIGLSTIGSTVYIARDGQGYTPLIAGEGAPSDLYAWISTNHTWLYGETVYSRLIGSGSGAIYQLEGNTISLIEDRPMRLPSGISGYFLDRFFVAPKTAIPGDLS